MAAATAPGYLATARGRGALGAMASGKVGAGGAATKDRPGANELRVDEKTFAQIAEGTKSGCPISQALSATKIELEAKLLK